MFRVFVDGSSGTAGLRILDRLEARRDLELIRLPEESRRDPEARKEAMNRADAVFFCLPDEAAREAAAWVENPETVLIDTSTAHRVCEAWTYGFPEIHGLREKIRSGRRIANPGCHASGFLALAAPLTEEGALSPEERLTCFSLTGYSGGGKKMIAEYEDPGRDALLEAPRQYGLAQRHKHLPEMKKYGGLTFEPVFCPVVAPYYAGMEVTLPLHGSQLKIPAGRLKELYRDYYAGSRLIHVAEETDEAGFCSAGRFAGRDDLEIQVAGNEDRVLLIARFDNLGKGASGAAIQNLNLRMGVPEETGLVFEEGGKA